MKILKKNFKNLKLIIFSFFILLFFSDKSLSNDVLFEIEGNNFTDTDAILSLLNNVPENVDAEYSDEILKTLNDSNLFSEVIVKYVDNKYIIIVKEYLNINNLYFSNNERLKDEDLELIALQLNLNNYNSRSVNLFINEIKKLYQSYGYNNVKIEYSKRIRRY